MISIIVVVNEVDLLERKLQYICQQFGVWCQSLFVCLGFVSFGKVLQVLGILVEVYMLLVQIGEFCYLCDLYVESLLILVEVVGFIDKVVILLVLSLLEGVFSSIVIEFLWCVYSIEVGDYLFGCVLDGFGCWMFCVLVVVENVVIWCVMLLVMCDVFKVIDWLCILVLLVMGVWVIDGLLIMGIGQCIGVFVGLGCGKIMLMVVIVCGCEVQVIVFGLIGECG